MLVSLLVALLVVFVAVQALTEVPERARGGEYYKEHVRKYGKLRSADSTAKTWDAPVDHFDVASKSTFKQRYYVNDQYWSGSGPVFYEIGGEGTLNGPPAGFIGELAKNHSALIIALEHRFYGESIPNGNANTENYRFLTVEQALADLSSFTDFYKSLVPKSAGVPWFVFGGSYPGALASWYRTAYPDQSVGSLSSSGVVNCIIDYYDFDMSVSAAAGNECGNNIHRIQKAFESTIKSDPNGLANALNLFHCEPDMSETDFYYMIADSWSMVIQYSSKSKLCAAIDLPADATPQQIMENFASFSNRYWGQSFCSGGFYNTKQLADPKRWDINSRSWRWQTCYQVSYFNTAPPSGSLRAQQVNLDYHLKQCEEAFGIKMFPSSQRMNQVYGGAFPKAEKVFYSDFSDDPWQRASVDFPVSESQPYNLAQCDDCGHCLDFHQPLSTDPAALTQGREEFAKYLDLWLTEGAAEIKKKQMYKMNK